MSAVLRGIVAGLLLIGALLTLPAFSPLWPPPPGGACDSIQIDVWDITYGGLASGTTTTSTFSASPVMGKGVICHSDGKWVYEGSKSLTNSNYGFGLITAGQDPTTGLVIGDAQVASCPAKPAAPHWCSLGMLNTGAADKYTEWNFAGSRNPVVPNPAISVANSHHFRYAFHFNVTPGNHLAWWQDFTADPSTWYGGSVGAADPATDTNGFAFSSAVGTQWFIGAGCTVACGTITMFPHGTAYGAYKQWQQCCS